MCTCVWCVCVCRGTSGLTCRGKSVSSHLSSCLSQGLPRHFLLHLKDPHYSVSISDLPMRSPGIQASIVSHMAYIHNFWEFKTRSLNLYNLYDVLSFMTYHLLSTWHTLKSPGKSETQLRNFLDHIGLWACLWSIVSSVNQLMRAQPIMGGAIPQQGVLCYVRKLAEHNPVSEPACRLPLWFLLQVLSLSVCSDFPWWQIMTWKYRMKCPSYASCFGHVTCHNDRMKPEHKKKYFIYWAYVCILNHQKYVCI